VVDKKPDGTDMVFPLFGKGQRLPGQTRHPMPRGNPGFLRVGDKLPLAVLATVLLAPCQRADAVFDGGGGVAVGAIHRGKMGIS